MQPHPRVRLRRVRAKGGDHHRGSDDVQPHEGGDGGGVRPGEERRDQRDRRQRQCRPHESLGGSSTPTTKGGGDGHTDDGEEAGHRGESDNGIVAPPAGTWKSTPTARASAAATVVAAIAASVARRPVPTSRPSRGGLRSAPVSGGDDPSVFHAAHVVPPLFGSWRTGWWLARDGSCGSRGVGWRKEDQAGTESSCSQACQAGSSRRT